MTRKCCQTDDSAALSRHSTENRGRDRTYQAAIGAGRLALRALDLTVRSEGQANVPATGPVVLAINHVSFPDFVFVQQALLPDAGRGVGPGFRGRLVRFMCRYEIWASPFGPAMEAMRHVAVDRNAPAAAYLSGCRRLRDGEVLGVFPEGGISAAYVVRAMMPGAVALARVTGAVLVPVNVWGSQRLWPQKRTLDAPFPRPALSRGRLVDVRFRTPVTVPPDADVIQTTRALGRRLQSGLEELQGLAEHRPRPGEWAPWYPAHLGGAGIERGASFALDTMPRSAVAPDWGPNPDASRPGPMRTVGS